MEGVRTAGHGGSANGQFAELLIMPERNFAIVSLANAGGRHPVQPGHRALGVAENDAMALTITTGPAGIRLKVILKPEIRAAAGKEAPPDYPPFDFGLLPGKTDEYILTTGALAGQRGFFTRDSNGSVASIDLAGRLFRRAETSPA